MVCSWMGLVESFDEHSDQFYNNVAASGVETTMQIWATVLGTVDIPLQCQVEIQELAHRLP